MRRSKRLPFEELAPYLLPLPDPPAPYDWTTVFGKHQPVELEIGFGKGLFLVSESAARPEVNFVGVEIVRKYQLFTATRLAKRGRTNVRVACADARMFLRDRVAARSVQTVHVYFPDPWWKKRHLKRRVFTADFAAECGRVLQSGGLLSIATDVEEYFSLMKELVAAQPTLQPLPPPAVTETGNELDYMTNFERKARQQGRPIYRGIWKKG